MNMNFDVYQGETLIYSTDAPAHQVALREGEGVAEHGSAAILSPEAWAALQAASQAQADAPKSATRAQGKAALIQAGYWQGVLAFVASIGDETQRALAEVALHDTQEWQRSSPFLNAAAAGLGITDEQLDALFVAAREIQL